MWHQATSRLGSRSATRLAFGPDRVRVLTATKVDTSCVGSGCEQRQLVIEAARSDDSNSFPHSGQKHPLSGVLLSIVLARIKAFQSP